MKVVSKTFFVIILLCMGICAAQAAFPSPLFDILPPDGYILEEVELDIGYTYTFYNSTDRTMGLGILIRSMKPGETLEAVMQDILGLETMPGATGDMGSMDLKKEIVPKEVDEEDRLVPKIINLRELDDQETKRYGCDKGIYATYDYISIGIKYEMMFLQRKAKVYAVGFSLPVDKWADNAAVLRNAMLSFRLR